MSVYVNVGGHRKVCVCVRVCECVCLCVCVYVRTANVCVCVFPPWALTSSYAERVLLSSVLGTMPPLHASSSSPADSHIYVHLLGARGGIWWLRSLPPSSFRPNFFLFCFVFPTMEKDCSRTTPLQLFTNDGDQSDHGPDWSTTMYVTFTFYFYSDAFIQSDLHPFIHTFTHRRRSPPRRATASSSGGFRVRSSRTGTTRHSARRSRGSN